MGGSQGSVQTHFVHYTEDIWRIKKEFSSLKVSPATFLSQLTTLDLLSFSFSNNINSFFK